MKYVTDKLLQDLGFDVNIHNPNEFKPIAENVLNMPFTAFSMSKKALDTHIVNLIETFGKEAVIDALIARIK